jgi:hypothetical protein
MMNFFVGGLEDSIGEWGSVDGGHFWVINGRSSVTKGCYLLFVPFQFFFLCCCWVRILDLPRRGFFNLNLYQGCFVIHCYSRLFTATNAVAESAVKMLDLALFLGRVPWSPDKRRVEN